VTVEELKNANRRNKRAVSFDIDLLFVVDVVVVAAAAATSDSKVMQIISSFSLFHNLSISLLVCLFRAFYCIHF